MLIAHGFVFLLDDKIYFQIKMNYLKRNYLEEVLEEDIFYNYEEYSNLLEDSEW